MTIEKITNKGLVGPIESNKLDTDIQNSLSLADSAYQQSDLPVIRQIEINSQSDDYTTVLVDAGKAIYHPQTDNNPRTFTIPSNASVAYAINTVITFINDSDSAVTIAIVDDALVLAGDGTLGSKTLESYGIATAVKVTSTRWFISGNNLS